MKKIFININKTRQLTLVIVPSLSNIFHYTRPYSRFTDHTLINIICNSYIAILSENQSTISLCTAVFVYFIKYKT